MPLLLCCCALQKQPVQLSCALVTDYTASYPSTLTSKSRNSCSNLFLTRSDMCAVAPTSACPLLSSSQ
jgi:hypothetical protein